jgi:hypothetical protein
MGTFLLTVGCTAEPVGPAEDVVSLPRDLLTGRSIVNVQRLDTDSDGVREWLAFYRFDQIGEQGPVAALIYDVVFDPGAQLPILYPFKLRTPNQSYLAQAEPGALMLELLPGRAVAGSKELVFLTPNELVVFQLSRDPSGPPSDSPALYRCAGFFRSAEGVDFNPESREVTVSSRSGYERSQLVVKFIYLPSGDSYFVPGTTDLLAPVDSAIDFPAGIPDDILNTPYPEKIVLAFFKTLGQSGATPSPADFLTDRAALELAANTLRLGSPYAYNQITSAVVKEISYYPTQDDTQATQVLVKVVYHTTVNGQDMASPVVPLSWSLVRSQGRWRMDQPQP